MRFVFHRWFTKMVPIGIKPPRDMGKKIRIIFCVTALILCFNGIWGCQKEKAADSSSARESTSTPKRIPEVKTAEVKLWRSDILQRFSGVVRPNKRTLLSTRMSGTLTHLYVDAGDKVEAGMLLAQVDVRDIIAALDAAQAQLEAAQSGYAKAQLDVKRLQRLYAEELIARNRLERAQVMSNDRKAALEQARTQVRLQQTNLKYARISAPFDGIVSEVPIDQGSFVGPGTTLVILEDRSSFRIDVPISAHAANSLRKNTPRFMVKTSTMHQLRTATYQDIIPSMEKGGVGQILRLRLKAEDDDVHPGQIADVVLENTQQGDKTTDIDSHVPVTAVPRSALIRQGQLTSVMLVEEAPEEDTSYRIKKRWIVTASSNTSSKRASISEYTAEYTVKVLQGLQPGERVVLNPASTLNDEDSVRLATEPN